MRGAKHQNLWQGCVGAWCPSVDRSRSTLLTDQSVYSSHGTLTNMDAATDWVASDGKVALDFDGNQDRVSISNSSIFSITDAITICGWVNIRQTASGQYPALIDKNRNSQWTLLCAYSGGLNARFICNIGGVRRDLVGPLTATGTWMFLAGTYQNGVMRIHVDNNYVESTTYSGAIGTGTSAITFGTMSDFESSSLNGFLDDLRVYNRALTPSEIILLSLRRGIAYEMLPRRRSVLAGGSGTDDLTATGVDTGAPSVGAPAIGQAHSLSASAITTGDPSVGSPALGQVHALSASSISSGAPSAGTPALGQSHTLTATSVSTGSPSVGGPGIGQVHVLSATGVAAGSPSVGSPSLDSSSSVDDLTANGVSTAAPSVGTPSLGQVHSLSASSLSTAAPSVGSPAIGQLHALVASAIASGAPSVGGPSLGQVHVLLASGVATDSPSVGSPWLDRTTTFRPYWAANSNIFVGL